MSSKHLNAQYNLRWPDELKEKIAQSAKEHNRSMNADIIARLERSFLIEPNFSPLNMSPEELEARVKQPIPKEVISDVIDLFVKKLEDSNFEIVKKNQEK